MATTLYPNKIVCIITVSLFKPLNSLLGLHALHEITSSGSYRLRVDLEDWEGNHAYAEYS